MLIEELIEVDATVSEPSLPDSVRRDTSMLRYMCTVLAVVAVLYLLPPIAIRSGLWDRWNRSFYAQPMNYAFETAGLDADVVVFGDSTATLGIDPGQMSSALGVKVLNLPNTQDSLIINDDLALRHYLSGNRPPRLIVFYLAPWDLDYGNVDPATRPLYEGEELLFRQGSWQQWRAFVFKHPELALSFPLQFYSTNLQFIRHGVRVPHQQAQLNATLGHVDNLVNSALDSSCSFPAPLIDSIRFSWVHDLAARYRSPQTRVMVYVAPVPSCANVSQVVNQPYEQLPAAPPKQMPPNFYNDPAMYVHPRTLAVPQVTRDLTDAVRPMLAASDQSALPATANQQQSAH